jgi:RNA polymerase sigma-70 factor (ECF subfamily)
MSNKHKKQELEGFVDKALVTIFQSRGASADDAYGVLVRRHQPDLLRRCQARLGNRADAEEAVQETLVRVFRGLLRFRGDAAFRTWLFCIADNQCNTLCQRRSRLVMSEHVRALIELHQELSPEGREEREAPVIDLVRRSLANLPDPARDVLTLRFYGDLSLQEIAVTLDIGLSAAKMRFYRAMSQFEAALEASDLADAA